MRRSVRRVFRSRWRRIVAVSSGGRVVSFPPSNTVGRVLAVGTMGLGRGIFAISCDVYSSSLNRAGRSRRCPMPDAILTFPFCFI